MKLHLVRHAKTELKGSNSSDFERKLLPKGIVQANVLAYHMSQIKPKIDFTFCSDAFRTKETLQILNHLNDLGKIAFQHELYLSDREMYLKKIWEMKQNKNILMVGHNEGISEFASYLVEDDIEMKTCEYLEIEFTMDKWAEVSRGTGIIKSRFRPSVCLLDWKG